MPRQLSGLGTNVHAMAIGMGLRARAMLRQTALAVGAATSLGDAFAMSTLLARRRHFWRCCLHVQMAVVRFYERFPGNNTFFLGGRCITVSAAGGCVTVVGS